MTSVDQVFAGESAMAKRGRALDWARSPLGAVDGWSPALCTAVMLTLGSGFPMCVYAGPQLVLIYNDGFAKVLGLKHPWALGRATRQVWAEIWDVLSPELLGVLSGGEPTWHEDQQFLLERDGQPTAAYFTYTCSPIREADGRIVGVHNLCIETTARVAATRQLLSAHAALEARHESDSRYQAARDVALNGFMAFDVVRDEQGTLVDFIVRDVNTEAASLLGRERSDLVGRSVSELFPELVGTREAQAYARVVRTQQAEEDEFLSPMHPGRDVWIRQRIIPLADGIVVSARDITEERRTSEDHAARLRAEESESRFRTLAEAIPQIVWTAGPDGGVDYYNRRWFDYTGHSLAETVGWGWGAVIHADDLTIVVERWKEAVRNGTPFDCEFRLRGVDGSFRWHLGRAQPLHDAGGSIAKWFGTCTDIHVQKELHSELESRVLVRTAELHAAKDAAESANRAKSDFLARMSHELRTPLNSIIGFATIIGRNKRGTLSEAEINYAERIRANGNHLLELINDVLDLSKVEAGHIDLQWTKVRVDALIRDVCANLAHRAAGANVALEVDIGAPPRSETAPLRADEVRLRQVLLNLLSNAIKFTPAGGSLFVTLVSDESTGYPLRLDVRDTGIGIAAEAHERVFHAFEQAESGTTARYGGTGLGLPISRALCEAMGFRLTLESVLGEGSTFRVNFDRRAIARSAAT